MSLSHELAVQFAKITKDEETNKSDTIVYGTAVVHEGSTYVKLDGSDILTPVSTTAVVNDGERVSVLIKNHTASITGNSSSPAARAEDVAASSEDIKNLKADNITIKNDISAANANIKNLQAADVTIQKNLSAAETDIKELKDMDTDVTALKADVSSIKDSLSAANTNITNLQAADVTIKKNLETAEADIEKLKGIGTDVTALKADVKTLKKEISTVLRIESSRGTVFKNNQVSTVLSAVIYKGSKRITDISTLKSEYGDTAYLEWSEQGLNEDSFTAILSTDGRISNDGFSLTLSPEDVDTKVTFMCQLITD